MSATGPQASPSWTSAPQSCCPGLVDTHVHINDPGRADWEGFEHATRAAAAGGVTTLVDMPLNSIPATTTVAGLERKRTAARGRCHVDVGFWGGVVPGNAADLAPLARAGVLGFKCFLCPSGVDEFGHVGESDLRDGAPDPGGARAAAPGARGAAGVASRRDAAGRRGTLDPRRYRDLARESSGRQRAGRHRDARAARHRVRRARPRRPPRVGRGAAGDPCGPRGRRVAERGNVPALPDVCRRRDCRRRDGVQVRAADPLASQSRAPVAGAGRRRASTWSRPTTRRRRRR